MLNIEQLKQDLNTYISGLTSTSSIENAMLVTAALDNLTEDRIVSLNTVNDLPDAHTISPGTVFFVKSINTLVFTTGIQWRGIDGRLLREDSIRALAWGNNINGQLGDGTVINKSSPITVIGGITKWEQVSIGWRHALGIANGIAYAWGGNGSGELGINLSSNRSSPVTVVGGITNWNQLDGGFGHSVGISDNILYSWGRNDSGQLGDGTVTFRSSPVTVIGGITNWRQVSAGFTHTVGITITGIAYTWGSNLNGRLGDGTVITRSSPVTVIGGITNWSQVSGGSSHSIGIANGIAYVWGYNNTGALGDGTVIAKSSPVTVLGGITNWSSVSAGNSHSLGIANGIAYAWGYNANIGKLGDGTLINRSSPVTVVGGITNWSQVNTKRNVSSGISNGIAYVWGENTNGILGDGTTTNRSSPVTIVGGITNWTSVSSGEIFTLALKAD